MDGRFVGPELIVDECRDEVRESIEFRLMGMMDEGAEGFEGRKDCFNKEALLQHDLVAVACWSYFCGF